MTKGLVVSCYFRGIRFSWYFRFAFVDFIAPLWGKTSHPRLGLLSQCDCLVSCKGNPLIESVFDQSSSSSTCPVQLNDRKVNSNYLRKINEIVNLMNFPANESVSINFRFEFNNLFGEILNWCGPDPTPGSPNLASGCYGLRPTLRAQRCYALNVFCSWVKPLPPKKNHAKNWAGNMTLSQ